MHELKLAIATEDIEAIQMLTTKLPEFESVEKMKEAAFIIHAAKALMLSKQDTLKVEMGKLKQARDFIAASQGKRAYRLNIIS